MKLQHTFGLFFCIPLVACGDGAAASGSLPHRPAVTQPGGPGVHGTAPTPGPAPAPPPAEPVPVGVAPACTPSLTADVNITITSRMGPQGGAPLAVTNNLLDMNIDDQVRDDYVPALNPQFVAYLKALKPALLRWPAGYYGQQYQWQTTGSGPTIMTPALVDAFMSLSTAVGAEPFLAINLSTGTPANAAAFVTYVRVQKNYPVSWWQLGNEPDVYGLSSVNNPQNYAASYLQFAQTVHSIDPAAKLVGGELETGEDILGQGGDTDWLTPILQTAGQNMDAIAWHYYPMDSSQTNPNSSAQPSSAHLLQEDASDWPPAGLDFVSKIMPKLTSLRSQYAPHAQLWIDEFAEDSGQANGVGTGDRMVGALWAADALGRYAESGTDALFKFIFKGGPEHGYTLLDAQNNPRPEYYTYWLYAQQFGDHMVASSSDNIGQVAAHAATRASDGSLRVILVNKAGVAQNAHLNLADFSAKQAAVYTLAGASNDAATASLNNQTLTPGNVGQGALAIAPQAAAACANNVLSLPPFSVTLLIYSR